MAGGDVGAFLEAEKERYVRFKAEWPGFSDEARQAGEYRGRLRPFCLPHACAEKNLYSGIRESVTAYFERNAIKWHDGRDRRPSVHLCDSQVCCANMLFPFADQPEALAHLLRPLYPDLAEMLCVEDGLFVGHEWIGACNYLHEVSRNGVRTRGANYTSSDGIVRFRRTDGSVQVVLIEWKYCESYGGANLRYAKSGKDRTCIYRWLYERDDCPLDKVTLDCIGFEALFFEPFYQFLRQQLLAHEMELSHELCADRVRLLHIAPAHNADFRRVTSKALKPLGDTATDVWSRLVVPRDRFRSVSTEALFGPLRVAPLPQMAHWLAYVVARYPWVFEGSDSIG